MKKITSYIILLSAMLVLVGCSQNSQSQANPKDNLDTQGPTEYVSEEKTTTAITFDKESTSSETQSVPKGKDYDLTTLDSNHVYHALEQLLLKPEDYIGGTIRIKGEYSSVYYNHMQQYYHYILVADHDGCSQMLEFKWVDGSDLFPDKHPAEGTIIEVVGILESYQDKGDPSIYYRLNTTGFKVVK